MIEQPVASHAEPADPHDALEDARMGAAWQRFVELLVNQPWRFECERGVHGLARQGVLAHVLFAVAAGRPRLSVPVACVPEFRRGALAELLESRELVRCTSPRGSAHVAPAILLDAVRQLPDRIRTRLLAQDPVRNAWREWLRVAPPPRPLTEVASDALAYAVEGGRGAEAREALRAVAIAFGIGNVAAMLHGAAPEPSGQPLPPDLATTVAGAALRLP
jgi:hypothetical protein